MNYDHRISVFAAMIAATLSAAAQEVYENVDKEGVVEFSDQPSTGAREVDVRPNVVNVAPGKAVKPASPASAIGAEKAVEGGVQPEVIQQEVSGDYYGDYDNRRERDRVREELMDHGSHGKEVIQQPAHKAPGRGAAPKGASHR